MENTVIRFLLIVLVLFASPVFSQEIVQLKSYKASYSVKYRGFQAGYVHFVLLPQKENTYVYLTRVEPGLLARLVVSPEAFERTILKIDEHGVRPLSWMSEDGKSKTEDDGELTFDWDEQRVYGTVEDEEVEFPLEHGLQNRLSMQIQVLTALLSDEEPGSITVLDGEKIKHYNYVMKETQQVDSVAGRYHTILYESSREGSSRLKRIYHAPELDYIPVRFENLKNGKLETVMELVKVDLKDGNPQVVQNDSDSLE